MFLSTVRRAASWMAGCALLACLAGAAEMNWLDIESRIQYGYYTEDVRSLEKVMELLAPTDSESASRSYYAGLGSYRLAQLRAAKDKSGAKDSAEGCVRNLDLAVKLRKDFADALALSSVCLEQLATLEAWRTPLASSKSGSQIEKARHAGPKNPRVMLLDAVEVYERPNASPADKDRALVGFKNATAAFEAERQEAEHTPGWGAAEAYLYLARAYLDRGAAVEARDALEHALLLAPEFAEARRLMKRITSG
jgi:tetratricopeptide (TPR) repeat protein